MVNLTFASRNKRYCNICDVNLIYPFRLAFIKACIRITFIKIIHIQIISWSFILYDIMLLEYPANILFPFAIPTTFYSTNSHFYNIL